MTMVRYADLLVPRVLSCVVMILGCLLVVGCGESSHNQSLSKSGTTLTVPDTMVGIARGESGKIVDPERVPGILRRTGLHIVFRPGPIPPGFVSAIYGTASNSHGASINFGFFFVTNDKAGSYNRAELEKLVPEATDEGSTNGESYIVDTSAGTRDKRIGPRIREEEFGMAGELHWAVAGLAPKALKEEGP